MTSNLQHHFWEVVSTLPWSDRTISVCYPLGSSVSCFYKKNLCMRDSYAGRSAKIFEVTIQQIFLIVRTDWSSHSDNCRAVEFAARWNYFYKSISVGIWKTVANVVSVLCFCSVFVSLLALFMGVIHGGHLFYISCITIQVSWSWLLHGAYMYVSTFHYAWSLGHASEMG